MRRYYISQRFCITLCVGITFRNVYYIMRFNTRSILTLCLVSILPWFWSITKIVVNSPPGRYSYLAEAWRLSSSASTEGLGTRVSCMFPISHTSRPHPSSPEYKLYLYYQPTLIKIQIVAIIRGLLFLNPFTVTPIGYYNVPVCVWSLQEFPNNFQSDCKQFQMEIALYKWHFTIIIIIIIIHN